ncbi:MAG: RNA methyltransferase [Caldisphaera sp.]|jgi:rRNA methylase|uniref:TrmH family RNA methyltransferase n=1 Tax=Caldisphaera sp. TaxID=2060322 RepID=UPI00397B0C8E
MKSLRLVAVGIEGSINLGYLLRLAENFDVDEIYLVSPIASAYEASRWAVKASNQIYNTIIVDSIDKALEGVDLSICTSDESSAKDVLRIPITPKQASELAEKVNNRVALVLGRESVGLTRDELKKCDLLCTIPSSQKYKALNVSNAGAIMLYELYLAKNKPLSLELADKKTVNLIEAYARALVSDSFEQNELEDIMIALRKAISKSEKGEAARILKLISRICLKYGCKDKLQYKE